MHSVKPLLSLGRVNSKKGYSTQGVKTELHNTPGTASTTHQLSRGVCLLTNSAVCPVLKIFTDSFIQGFMQASSSS